MDRDVNELWDIGRSGKRLVPVGAMADTTRIAFGLECHSCR